MVKVTVNPRDLAKLTLKLVAISRAKWILPALTESGEYLIQSTNRAIRKGVDIEGSAFVPLTDPYVERPRDQGGRGGDRTPILERTGGMVMSLIAKTTKTSVIVSPGTSKMRALWSYHQNPRPNGRMPRRAGLGIRDYDVKPILRIFKKHVDQAIKVAG